MLKKKRKIKQAIESRPEPREFGISRYMCRDGIIFMKDETGEVYALFNGFWDDPEKELHRLRGLEIKQKRKRK